MMAPGTQANHPGAMMIDATTLRPQTPTSRRATPIRFGYGYLLWLLPGNRRQLPCSATGPAIVVDPASKLILVQTGLEAINEVWPL